ncbi:MAG: hypothetical protein WDO24_25075 [Pseudomonadota bacterium]
MFLTARLPPMSRRWPRSCARPDPARRLVVVRRPDEADAGLHGDCSAEFQQRIDGIVRSILSAHHDNGGTTH